jgi:hypothetical protein
LQSRTYAIKLQKQKLDQFALEVYMNNAPPCIKEAMNKHRNFLTFTDEIRFRSTTNQVTIRIASPLPYSGNYLLISTVEYRGIMSVKNELGTLEIEYARLLTDTIDVLMRLRTRENVLREFPILDKFIPEVKVSKSPSLDEIKKRLK